MCLNREYFNKSLGFFLNTKLVFKKVLQGKEKKNTTTRQKQTPTRIVCVQKRMMIDFITSVYRSIPNKHATSFKFRKVHFIEVWITFAFSR